MKEKLKDLSISLRLLLITIVIFVILYSGIIGAIGHTLWGEKAGGSLIENRDGEIIGSELIGQDFSNPYFFHSRPSSINYDARTSGGQNLGPDNPILSERVENILKGIVENRKEENLKIPSDLVTESASALSPYITVEAAKFQIPRVAEESGISEQTLENLVEKHSKGELLGLYGMERVNVLKLNIEILNLLGDNIA